MNTAAPESHTAKMQYKSFYALGVFLKDQSLVQLKQESRDLRNSRVHDFYCHLQRYRQHRKNLCREYKAASESEWDAPPANRLYQPLHLWTFGYIDELIFVLVDTPDFYFRVFGDSTIAVSQVCLAAVPNLLSLGIEPRRNVDRTESPDPFIGDGWNFPEFLRRTIGDDLPTTFSQPVFRTKLNPFLNIEDLFDPQTNGDLHSDREENPAPERHPLRLDTPLTLFSRIRLSSACNLGGIVMRRAVYRLIARVVVATQIRLLMSLERDAENATSKYPQEFGCLNALQVTKDEICSLSVCFLDNFGPEELGILIGSRNYSVAFAVHNAIQGMTFRDLIDAEKHMQSDILNSRIHHSLRAMLHTPDEGLHPDDKRNLMLDNHLISLTHTNVGMVSETLDALNGNTSTNCSFPGLARLNRIPQQEIAGHIRGFAEITVRGTVNAGHNSDADATFREISNCFRHETSPLRMPWNSELLRVVVGRYDLELHGGTDSRETKISAIPVHTIFTGMNKALQLISESDGVKDETGIAEISTVIVVPVPQFQEDKKTGKSQFPVRSVSHDGYTALIKALKNIELEVFGDTPESVMSPLRLSAAARYLRMPIRLRRIVGAVANVFQTALTDPLLFDHVLDLYDCVIALDHAITHDLPELTSQALEHLNLESSLQKNEQTPLEKSYPELIRKVEETLDGSMGRGVITSLGEYAQALSDALDRRISIETQHEFSEFAVDLRGGLVQLIHAAGVALKCGGGLLRFAFETDFGTYTERIPTSKRVGVINRLTVHDVREASRIDLGPGSESELAVLTFGVGHLISPLEFEIYIYESARMLLSAWDEQDGAIPVPQRPRQGYEDPLNIRMEPEFFRFTDEDRNRSMELREQLFAIALTQTLVYGGSKEDLIIGQRGSVAAFDARHDASNMNEADSYRKFAMFMLTSFLATSCLSNSNQSKSDANSPSFSTHRQWFKGGLPDDQYRDVSSKQFKLVWKEFIEFCRQHSQFFHRHRGFLAWLENVVNVIHDTEKLTSTKNKASHIESAQALTREYLLQIDSLQDISWRVQRIHHSYRKYYWKSLRESDFKILERLVTDSLDKGIGSVNSLMEEFNSHLRQEYGDPIPGEYQYRGYSGNGYERSNEHVDELMILSLILKALAKRRISTDPYVPEGHFDPTSRSYTVSPISALHEDHLEDEWPLRGDMKKLVAGWNERHEFGGRTVGNSPPKNCPEDVVHDKRYNRFFGISPSTRSDLLRQEIAAIRMLWSLSTRQRSRRLFSLSKDIESARAKRSAITESTNASVANT